MTGNTEGHDCEGWVVVQEGISAIFEQAGCGTPAVRSLLGEGGVTEGNMMQYLGILEQRTNEILQVCPSSKHTYLPLINPHPSALHQPHTHLPPVCCAHHQQTVTVPCSAVNEAQWQAPPNHI